MTTNPTEPTARCTRGVDGSEGCGHESHLTDGRCAAHVFPGVFCYHHCDFSEQPTAETERQRRIVAFDPDKAIQEEAKDYTETPYAEMPDKQQPATRDELSPSCRPTPELDDATLVQVLLECYARSFLDANNEVAHQRWVECKAEVLSRLAYRTPSTPVPEKPWKITAEDKPDEFGHINFRFGKEDFDCCKICGLVRPHDGWKKQCKGPVEITLRVAPPISLTDAVRAAARRILSRTVSVGWKHMRVDGAEAAIAEIILAHITPVLRGVDAVGLEAWTTRARTSIQSAAAYFTDSGPCWCGSRWPDSLNGEQRKDDDHDDDCVAFRALMAEPPSPLSPTHREKEVSDANES